MITVFEVAAFGAALCWAVAGLVSRNASQALGAISFNRLRMVQVLFMLVVWSLFSGGFATFEPWHWYPIIASGFIGIFLGDTALFLTMNRLGPRRTAILFSLNAPISAFLGWLVLGEVLTLRETTGILTVFAGVVIAIVFGKRRSQLHQWEHVEGSLMVGAAIGFVAALCQSVGSLIARPVMETGIDPAAASAVRVAVAVFALTLLMQIRHPRLAQKSPITRKLFVTTAFSGFLGMAAGMTLILFALSGGELGIISTLSATSPALMLPLIWAKTGERPAVPAWFGAALVIVGSALIFGW